MTSKTIQNWKKQFLTNASKAFESDDSSKADKEELAKFKSENDALAKTLGRTTVKRDWAVEKLESLDLSNKKRPCRLQAHTLKDKPMQTT